MTNKRDFFDQALTRHVRVQEEEVPVAVEEAFMEALQQVEPMAPAAPVVPSKGRLVLHGGLLAAATILLAVVMLIVYMVFQQSNPATIQVVEAAEVSVQDCYVEGQPANTFVVNPKDADMTIVWIEKIKN